MRRARNSILLASLLLFTLPAHAAEPAGMSELDVGEAGHSGYVKSYALGIIPKQVTGAPDGSGSDPGWQSLNAIRLNGFYRPALDLKLEAGYELQPVWQNEAAARLGSAAGSLGSSLPLVRGASYRVLDLDTEITDPGAERTFRLYQNLDRLAAYWRIEKADITIGRQAIAFGSARAIQPTDVLLPYSFQQLSVEYRIGVDAVRAQIPVSRMGELDLGVVLGEGLRSEESAAFGRIRIAAARTDIIATAMIFSGAKMLGGGIQRGIWQLGYFLDFAQVWADNNERYFRLSQGLDYSFESGLMLFAEYHYNGAGTDEPADYLKGLSRFAYQTGGVFLLGRQYLIPGLAYPITPLLSGRVQAMVNLLDGSTFVSGGLEYGMTEDIYLDLGFFGTVGDGPRRAGDEVLLTSEFGSYPNQVYAAARWYF